MPYIPKKSVSMPAPRVSTETNKSVAPVKFGTAPRDHGHRILTYGPGGIGKTTLCSRLPGPIAFFDLDESLGKLGIVDDNVKPVDGIETWKDLIDALQAPGWDSIKSIVIDTATRAEELCVNYTLATVKNDKGSTVNSIEGYGYGKGFQHVFEVWLTLLSVLDKHCRAGRHVVLVCHDCTSNVPNPMGDDWLRYEPRLQSPSSGKASIRLRVREWADHVLYIGYDIDVDEDGKGRGVGTRTMYPCELPHCMAKSRTTAEPISIEEGVDVWETIIR